MSLPAVQAYIEAHGHLPAVPSAAQIKAEGLSMPRMLRTHMAKIEELTLYAIEQDEQIQALAECNAGLEADNEALRSENTALRARMERIEAAVRELQERR